MFYFVEFPRGDFVAVQDSRNKKTDSLLRLIHTSPYSNVAVIDCFVFGLRIFRYTRRT